MIRTSVLIAAALTAPSLAQDESVVVSLTHDDTDGVIQIGETVTWTVMISIDDPEGELWIGGANMEILGDNTLGTSTDLAYTAIHDDTEYPFNGGTSGGASNGAGIGLVNFSNLAFLECFGPQCNPARANPLTVGTFDFTSAQRGVLNYDVERGSLNSPFFEIGFSAFTSIQVDDPELITFDIDTLTIVPAPASALLLAPAGLLATRRRR